MAEDLTLEQRILRATDAPPSPPVREDGDPGAELQDRARTPDWKNRLLDTGGFSTGEDKMFPVNCRQTFARCDSEPLEPLCLELLEGFGLVRNNEEWGIYFPCGYDRVRDVFKDLQPPDPACKIALIPGCNEIVSKTRLWFLLRNAYDRDGAALLMPETFVLSDAREMEKFQEFYRKKTLETPGAFFVLKNNQQRQEGVRLTGKLTEIEEARKNGYLLVQEFLKDPLLIGERKINLRFYLCITGWRGRMRLHVHRNGFVYYTRDPFLPDSPDFHRSITSGYVDRSIYRDNPLTHRDMLRWLENSGHDPENVMTGIDRLFQNVMDAVSPALCREPAFDENPKFQLFGADIALDSKLSPRLMEINKGPDMTVKGFRDGRVKEKILMDLLDLVNIVDSPHANEFRKIWDSADTAEKEKMPEPDGREGRAP